MVPSDAVPLCRPATPSFRRHELPSACAHHFVDVSGMRLRRPACPALTRGQLLHARAQRSSAWCLWRPGYALPTASALEACGSCATSHWHRHGQLSVAQASQSVLSRSRSLSGSPASVSLNYLALGPSARVHTPRGQQAIMRARRRAKTRSPSFIDEAVAASSLARSRGPTASRRAWLRAAGSPRRTAPTWRVPARRCASGSRRHRAGARRDGNRAASRMWRPMALHQFGRGAAPPVPLHGSRSIDARTEVDGPRHRQHHGRSASSVPVERAGRSGTKTN